MRGQVPCACRYRARAATLSAQVTKLKEVLAEESVGLQQTFFARLGVGVYHSALVESVQRLRQREVRRPCVCLQLSGPCVGPPTPTRGVEHAAPP